MYEDRTMKHVKIVLRSWGRRDKRERGGSESNKIYFKHIYLPPAKL
jgi:hypothetical protein